jgi:hypothetical protein
MNFTPMSCRGLLVALILVSGVSQPSFGQSGPKDLLSCSKCSRSQAKCSCKFCGYCAEEGHHESTCRKRLHDERVREESEKAERDELARKQRDADALNKQFEEARRKQIAATEAGIERRRKLEADLKQESDRSDERQHDSDSEQRIVPDAPRRKKEGFGVRQVLDLYRAWPSIARGNPFGNPQFVHGGVEPLEIAQDNFEDIFDDPVRSGLSKVVVGAGDRIVKQFDSGFASAAPSLGGWDGIGAPPPTSWQGGPIAGNSLLPPDEDMMGSLDSGIRPDEDLMRLFDAVQSGRKSHSVKRRPAAAASNANDMQSAGSDSSFTSIEQRRKPKTQADLLDAVPKR